MHRASYWTVSKDAFILSEMLPSGYCLPRVQGQCHPSQFGIFNNDIWENVLEKITYCICIGFFALRTKYFGSSLTVPVWVYIICITVWSRNWSDLLLYHKVYSDASQSALEEWRSMNEWENIRASYIKVFLKEQFWCQPWLHRFH